MGKIRYLKGIKMLNLYFTDAGILHLKSKVVDIDAENTFTKKIKVPDTFVLSVETDEGELATMREKTYDEIINELTYADKRVFEYPPIEDYLDAIVKDDTAAIEKYKADCLAVKAKYPKGE